VRLTPIVLLLVAVAACGGHEAQKVVAVVPDLPGPQTNTAFGDAASDDGGADGASAEGASADGGSPGNVTDPGDASGREGSDPADAACPAGMHRCPGACGTSPSACGTGTCPPPPTIPC
jgi:hypothetical protein